LIRLKLSAPVTDGGTSKSTVCADVFSCAGGCHGTPILDQPLAFARSNFRKKPSLPFFFIQSSQIAVLNLALNSKFLEANELGKDMVPKKIFFTKGVGKHRERLTSFELALRDAGIAAQNLVRVSSIFPPNCKLVPRSQGLKYLSPGEVVFAVVAENSTHEPHRLLASSIGVAIPADRNTYGYLSEHHSFGETEDAAGDYAEELAAEMLATTLNVEFDSDRSWDEKKEIYRISNKIVRTANVTQSAVGDKRGLWTTVIASAVLIFD
jgi:arginine decarboxylase